MDLQLRRAWRTRRAARWLSIGALASLLLAGPVGAATPAPIAWPTSEPLRVADAAGALGSNLSGLAPSGPASLWVVRDGPGALLALDRTGATWVPRDGWGDGRALRYPDGHAGPDAEAVTTVTGDAGAVYVGAERDNADSARPRNSVLRFDTTGQGALRATMEWRLDDLLPVGPANTGIEGLTWIADDTLVSIGLRDRTGATYRPADLPPHHGGLFVIGVEQRAELFVVALADDGRASVITTVPTGLASVMDVQWNAEYRELWAVCDNTCDGLMAVLRPAGGSFALAAIVRPPAGAKSLNDEGFARLPCRDSQTLVVWSDDSATGEHALRESALPCSSVDGASAAGATTTAATSTSRANTESDDAAAGAPTPDGGSDGGRRVVLATVGMVATVGAGIAAGRSWRRSRTSDHRGRAHRRG